MTNRAHTAMNRIPVEDRRWLIRELGDRAVAFDTIRSMAKAEGISDAALDEAIRVTGVQSIAYDGARHLARRSDAPVAAPAIARAAVAPPPPAVAAAPAAKPTLPPQPYSNAQMRRRIEMIVQSPAARGKEPIAARLAASAGVTIAQAIATLGVTEKSPPCTTTYIASATVHGILLSPEARGRENVAMALLQRGMSPDAAIPILAAAARDLPEERATEAERAEAEVIAARVAGFANRARR